MLEQNYPNPFERKTTIRYTMAKAGAVDLQVYNVLGRLLFSQVVTRQEPGSHFVMVDAKDWPSGVYLYRLQVDPIYLLLCGI